MDREMVPAGRWSLDEPCYPFASRRLAACRLPIRASANKSAPPKSTQRIPSPTPVGESEGPEVESAVKSVGPVSDAPSPGAVDASPVSVVVVVVVGATVVEVVDTDVVVVGATVVEVADCGLVVVVVARTCARVVVVVVVVVGRVAEVVVAEDVAGVVDVEGLVVTGVTWT
jgi:hypothetical protein